MADPRSALDVIRQRADNATDGPWEHNGINGVHTLVGSCVATSHRHKDVQRSADAEFIAAARSDVPKLVAALTAALDLAEWHETKADKARLYPGPGPENALIMTKSAAVHDDAARRLRAVIEAALTEKEDDS